MRIDLDLFMSKVFEVFRLGAMIGFIVTTVLIINLNNKAYSNVFRERSKTYFWFFLLLSIIPLLVFLYLFNFFFGKLTPALGAQ